MTVPAGGPDQLGSLWRRALRIEVGLSREGALLISLVALNLALVSNSGYVGYLALAGMGLCLAMLLIARRQPGGRPSQWLWFAVVASLGLAMLATKFGGWPRGWPLALPMVSAVAAAAMAWRGHRRAALGVGAVGALAFLGVCWRWDPSEIDVLFGMRSAGHALLGLRNPYLPTHPSTTLGAAHLVHFTYGPVVAIGSALGLLFGDPRVISALAAAALAWALLRLSQDRGQGWWLALSVCTAPLISAMIIYAWPLLWTCALTAWWLVLRERHLRLGVAVLALSLGCALVQMGPLLLVFLLRQRRMAREIVVAGCLALALVAAFAWWTGFAHFWYYTIGIHFSEARSRGAISLEGIVTLLGHHSLPGFLGVAAALLAIAYVVLRPRPGLSGLMMDGTLVTLVAMFFARLAFINYYFVAATTIWLAVAMAEPLRAGGLATGSTPAKEQAGSALVRVGAAQPATLGLGAGARGRARAASG
ncbi:MAG: hypothetical protein ACREOD_00850 [Candidatus Dormibacteria bacterium]